MGEHDESKDRRSGPSRGIKPDDGRLSAERLARRRDALDGLAGLRRKVGPTNVDVRALIDEGRR
jgi:hypothetical protein